MSGNNEDSDKLRKEAESRLKSFPSLREESSDEDVKKLLHELRVYQIELEMQNQELRDSQIKLEESRDQYSDLFEFAPVGYFILDKNGIILNCNLTGSTMLGVERSKLLRKPFSFVISSDLNEISVFRRYLRKIFETEEEQSIEILIRRDDETSFFARLNSIMIKDEKGNSINCRMAMTNISKEKKADYMKALVQANLEGQELERQRIAAELHDSINPLLSIASLNIQTIKDAYEENKTFPTEKIANSITILENIRLGLKEIYGNLSPELLKKFGLEVALKQLCQRIEETLQIKVELYFHGTHQKMDEKIELALYRIAQELFNNIVKHAQATEVELQLVQHQKSVILMVNDNGVGFDAPVEKLKVNGFGFKNISSRVQSLNGDVSFDSSKNKGTTVTIELPI